MMMQPNGTAAAAAPPAAAPMTQPPPHPIPPPQQWMMMQPNGGTPAAPAQAPPAAAPMTQPPPHPIPPPQQWMMPPPPLQQQTQYYQPAQAPPLWNQAPQPQPMPPQPQYQAAPAPPPASADEVRTLWIGDLQFWMDENYLNSCFAHTGDVISVKVIRNKLTGQSEGYGFIEFGTRATAEQVLQTYTGQMMPNAEQTFRLNWATFGAGKRGDDSVDYTIFVGDLTSDVTDYMLQETFRVHYPSVKGAKVVTDRTTGLSKGYGFVRFGDMNEQTRAMTEMQGMFCSTRPMRIGPAANKKNDAQQQYTTKAFSQTTTGIESEGDPYNTTIFVGGLDPSVTEDALRRLFSAYGELSHVKIPVGKHCGFVQFANRACAEEALLMLQGSFVGGKNIRLSWGRSPLNKQPQQDPNQWNSNYYGYAAQGYESYGYAAQDPTAYPYASYPAYGNYQQQQ